MPSEKKIKLFRANYEHMLNAPMFKSMQQRIKSLEEERKILRRVILELGRKMEYAASKDIVDLSQDDEYPENIKYELKHEPGT